MERSTSPKFERSTSGRLLAVSLEEAPRGQQARHLTDRLRALIRSGTLPADSPLPSSRSLAGDLGVSRGVVVRVYEQLLAEGYLQARRGSGTRVAHAASQPRRVPVAPLPRPSNPGLPPGASFPRRAWAQAAARAIGDLADRDLGYGDPAGLAALRVELSAYLGRVRAMQAPPDRILIVNGFAQTTRLVAEVLSAAAGPRVAVEDPGSPGLRSQLERAGATCLPVPVDGDGIRVDALTSVDANAVVVTPAHQFPTGAVLSPERRHALVRWARQTGSLIIEDDYDAELRYDRDPVGALQGLAPDLVLHGGSVSKSLAPGLRLGWAVVPEQLMSAFVAAKYDTDLASGVVEQATFASFLAAGEMDRHLRRMSTKYRRRRDRLVAELAARLPTWEVTGTAAGLHLLLRPPGDLDEAATASLLQRCGLDARPLRDYRVATVGPTGLVVGYAHRRSDALAQAVHRAAAAMERAGTST